MLIILSVLFACTCLYGQDTGIASQRQVFDISRALLDNEEYEYSIQSLTQTPFYVLSIKASPSDFRKLQHYDPISDQWVPLREEPHTTNDSLSLSHLFYLTEKKDRFKLRSTVNPLQAVELHIYSPGFSGSLEVEKSKLRSQDCPCPPPKVLQREEWCSSCGSGGSPFTIAPAFMIIHHSAGPNESSDWPAVVRSIWDYHVNVRGWDDIGYNYLIDPEGTVYQGRGDEIQGAHFCAANSGTLGICMLGTYSDELPAEKAIQHLKDLISWQNCYWQIDPLQRKYHSSTDKYLDAISGHRDGCATICPGDMLYGILPRLAEDIDLQMDTCGSADTGPVLSAERLNDYKIRLSWRDLSSSALTHSLQIFVDEILTENRSIGASPDSLTIYLLAGKSYEFQLLSKFEDGQTERSNIVNITSPYLSASQENLTIYPNPAEDNLRLKWLSSQNGTFQLDLIDQSGRIVTRNIFDKETVLFEKDLLITDLPTGHYILIIRNNTYTHHTAFLKVN